MEWGTVLDVADAEIDLREILRSKKRCDRKRDALFIERDIGEVVERCDGIADSVVNIQGRRVDDFNMGLFDDRRSFKSFLCNSGIKISHRCRLVGRNSYELGEIGGI